MGDSEDTLHGTLNIARITGEGDCNPAIETSIVNTKPVSPGRRITIHASRSDLEESCHSLFVKETDDEHGSAASVKWPVEDDILLLSSISHLCDIDDVAQQAVFSRVYTLSEICDRWKVLKSYDNVEAKERFSLKSRKEIYDVQKRTPFSRAEEEILLSGLDGTTPTPEKIDRLLKENHDVFHHTRNWQLLFHRWGLLRWARAVGTRRSVLPFDLTRVSPLYTGEMRVEEHRLERARSIARRHTLQLTGAIKDKKTLAMLRGRIVQFIMKGEKIVLGRTTQEQCVDVNLAVEAPSRKIARKQALIVYNSSTKVFTITNMGRRPILVDGKTLLDKNHTTLNDRSVIQVAHIKLVFTCL